MKNVEILANYEREINKLNDAIGKPSTEDSLFWLNQAAAKFVKLRFNGDFVHKTGYEQTEKRREDLISLFVSKVWNYPECRYGYEYLGCPELKTGEFSKDIPPQYDVPESRRFTSVLDEEQIEKSLNPYKEYSSDQIGDVFGIDIPVDYIEDKDVILVQVEIDTVDYVGVYSHYFIKKDYYQQFPDYDVYCIQYDKDFLYALNEDVVIESQFGDYPMSTCVFECTQDSFMYRINNSLTDFHYRYHRARPIRIRDSKGCKLLTDKKYQIKSYTLGYIKKPDEITLDKPFEEYKDFNDHVLYEIIKMAAQMYLENQSDDRYKTITQEVLTQE